MSSSSLVAKSLSIQTRLLMKIVLGFFSIFESAKMFMQIQTFGFWLSNAKLFVRCLYLYINYKNIQSFKKKKQWNTHHEFFTQKEKCTNMFFLNSKLVKVKLLKVLSFSSIILIFFYIWHISIIESMVVILYLIIIEMVINCL